MFFSTIWCTSTIAISARRTGGASAPRHRPGPRPAMPDPAGPGCHSEGTHPVPAPSNEEPGVRRSARHAQNLRFGREPPGRLFGVTQPAIHDDFKHAAARPFQADFGIGVGFQQLITGRTGSWLIASHAAIFDFDPHGLTSHWEQSREIAWQQAADWARKA